MSVRQYEARRTVGETRMMDPARGPFAVAPLRRNKRDVNRPEKTRQDRMPVEARPRVVAAARRREAAA